MRFSNLVPQGSVKTKSQNAKQMPRHDKGNTSSCPKTHNGKIEYTKGLKFLTQKKLKSVAEVCSTPFFVAKRRSREKRTEAARVLKKPPPEGAAAGAA
jgi:hypothetical protein